MKNPIIKSLLLFLGIYFTLLVCVNFGGGKEQFANFYRSQAELFYQSFGDGGEVEIKKYKKEKHFDTLFILTSKKQKQKAIQTARRQGAKTTKIKPVKFPLNTWNAAGLYFLFFLSLILATPVTWKNRVKALFLGGFILYAFMIAKIGLSLWLKFSIYHERFGLGVESDVMLNAINYLNNIISVPFLGLILATLTWLFFCFPKIQLNPKPKVEIKALESSEVV